MIIRIENNTQITVLAVSVLFAVLAITSVSLRFYARNIKQTPVKADDWCILVALVRAQLNDTALSRMTTDTVRYWPLALYHVI
jgi:hypothetical protein